jgi:cytochrome c oxidase cbb3-type subunit 1
MTSPSQLYSKASSAALVLLGGSLIWSLLAGGLQILSTLQLLVPLLSRILPISFFGYGRLVPAYTFLLTYGWIGSGLLGVLIILVPRISGIAFRYGRVLLGGALLWQLGVLIGLTQLLWEGSTGLLSLSFSSSITLIFLTSFLVLGTGITRGLGGAWKSGPLLPRLYLLGALLAFPLGLGTSELILRHSLAPGSVQIITQLVGYSFLHHLWLTPLALVLLFQLFTALTGRAVSSLPLGLLSWMATFTLGGWLGNALMSDGPVPSWMQSAGVVSTLLIFVAALGN